MRQSQYGAITANSSVGQEHDSAKPNTPSLSSTIEVTPTNGSPKQIRRHRTLPSDVRGAGRLDSWPEREPLWGALLTARILSHYKLDLVNSNVERDTVRQIL